MFIQESETLIQNHQKTQNLIKQDTDFHFLTVAFLTAEIQKLSEIVQKEDLM